MKKLKSVLSLGIIAILAISLFASTSPVGATRARVDIGVEELVQLLGTDQDITMLDVRTLAEYESGHIPRAISIPLSELEGRIDELNRDGAIIVYCKSGIRSEEGCNILVNHGFENVYNLLGGINAWTDIGLPVVSPSTVSQEEQECPCEANPSDTHDLCETEPEKCTCEKDTCADVCIAEVVEEITPACFAACVFCALQPWTCSAAEWICGIEVSGIISCFFECYPELGGDPCHPEYGYICTPCEVKPPETRRCYDSDTYEVEICRCDGQGWDNWKRKDCPEGKKCVDGYCRDPPRAFFSWSPYIPKPDQTVTFTSESYDPDGTIVKWHWWFGDDGEAEGEIVTHSYSQMGDYEVRLQVTDDDGLTSETSTSIKVAFIGANRDFTEFNKSVVRPLSVIDFDDIPPGISLVQHDMVLFTHSVATTAFKTCDDPLAFTPVSPPNVLAAYRPDGTFEFGLTTLTFPPGTGAAGLYLVMVKGRSSAVFMTSTVTAVDFIGNSLTVSVTFQGEVGEQRFIGLSSPFGIRSVSFTVASRPGYASVVSIDDVSYAWHPIETCDQDGYYKDKFYPGEPVYVRGGPGLGYPWTVDIYAVADGGLPVAIAHATTEAPGILPITLLWDAPYLGGYDIWVDMNRNGLYDDGDLWMEQALRIYAFFVIPELPLGTVTALLLMLVALVLFQRRSLIRIKT